MYSMTLVTILQTIYVFIAYSLSIFVFPGLVFGKRFAGYSFSKRFLFYFVIGNFYMINMVLLLAVFRIAYAPVMIGITVLFIIIGRIIVNHVPVRKRAASMLDSFRRLTRGSLGTKSAAFQLGGLFGRIAASLAVWFRENVLKKLIDWVLIAGVIAALAYMYGSNLIKYYGYAASDTLVHNIWINYMSNNQVFASGVYPYGFHAIIYFIHKVFFLENYVILRVFSFVTVVFLHLTLIAAVRALSRSKYLIYGTTFLFILAPIFNTSTYNRFYASLPHEFGIVFVLPAIYCLFEYYRLKRREYDLRIQQREALRKEQIDRIISGEASQEFTLADSVMPQAATAAAQADAIDTAETPGHVISAPLPELTGPTPFERAFDKIKAFMSGDYEDYDDLDFLEGYYDKPEKDQIQAVSDAKPLEAVAPVDNEDIADESRDEIEAAAQDTANAQTNGADKGSEKPKKSIFDPVRAFLKKIHFLENRDAIIAIITLSMAVSLTVAIHFYAAMVVCICCFIIFVIFTLFVMNLRCGIRVLASGIIGLFMGFFPMIVAVMMGYTLHGSLYWGLTIIKNTMRFYNNTTGTYEASAWDYDYKQDYAGLDIPALVERTRQEVGEEMRIERQKRDFIFSDTVLASQAPVIRGSAESSSIIQRVIDNISYWTDKIHESGKRGWIVTTVSVPFLTYDVNNFPIYDHVHNSYIVLAVLGILYLLLKRKFYGGLLLSSAASISAVFMLPTLGFFYNLPLIMDGGRALEFHAYLVPFVAALLLDGILTLPLQFVKKEARQKALTFGANIASLAFVGLCLYATLAVGYLKIPLDSSRDLLPTMQQRNEAIISISSILKNEKDYTYTVVSANDERGMLWDHGFHAELAEFLWGMENLGDAGKVQIPTPTVFFFVEKRPISYGVPYEGVGNLVSQEGAANPLPDLEGDEMYGGFNRYILMSRMYYWCKAFEKLYPNEMKVYYETDDFVCYRLEQNPYRLFNFALDYDYNMRDRWQTLDPETGLPVDSTTEPTE